MTHYNEDIIWFIADFISWEFIIFSSLFLPPSLSLFLSLSSYSCFPLYFKVNIILESARMS